MSLVFKLPNKEKYAIIDVNFPVDVVDTLDKKPGAVYIGKLGVLSREFTRNLNLKPKMEIQICSGHSTYTAEYFVLNSNQLENAITHRGAFLRSDIKSLEQHAQMSKEELDKLLEIEKKIEA